MQKKINNYPIRMYDDLCRLLYEFAVSRKVERDIWPTFMMCNNSYDAAIIATKRLVGLGYRDDVADIYRRVTYRYLVGR